MTDLAIGLWSFPALLLLIFLRVPIGLSMFLAGFAGLMAVDGGALVPLARLKSETFTTFASYSLSIVPMFLLMGQFATLGGMSQALFKAAEAWLGHRRGGVAMAAIGACAGFGSICGSSLATAATMGRVALPELRAYGYAGGFSTATLAAGGATGKPAARSRSPSFNTSTASTTRAANTQPSAGNHLWPSNKGPLNKST